MAEGGGGAGAEEESLVDLLNRATNPSNREDDLAAIAAFVDKIKSDKDGPQMSVRLLAHKMQSPQEREALQGLTVLEHCVQKCDGRFHQEIGKFRFLNEMIKIVSPKYLGNLTTENVKHKTSRLMFSWTKTLTSEPKIAEAYNMLKRQGIILEDPAGPEEAVEEQPPPPPPREDTLFKDEEKQKLLQRLLRSKNPEDHQAANRLIKSIVKEEEERREKGLKRMSELEKVNNNVKLLQEMIDAFSGDSSNSNADRELMKELFDECERLRPNLFKLASDADDKDDSIADILKANDNLVKVLEAYQTQVVAVGGAGGVVKLLDVSEGDDAGDAATSSGASPPAAAASDLLSDDLQSLGLDSPSSMINPAASASASAVPPTGAAEELAGIFKSDETSAGASLAGLLPMQPTAVASSVVPSSSLSPPLDVAASSNHSASTASSTRVPDAAPNASPDWSNLSKVFSSLESTPADPDKSPTAEAVKPPANASVDVFEALKSVDPASTSALLDVALDAGPSTAIGKDAPLLQPKNLSTLPLPAQNGSAAVATATASTAKDATSPATSKGFEDINLMSRGLLENTMKEFGVAKKVLVSETPNAASVAAKLTLAELQKQKEEEAKQKVLQQQSSLSSSASEGDGKPLTTTTTTTKTARILTSPSLEEVSVKLEAVQPNASLAPISLYDQHGLKILLFFAQVSCYPSPEIAVAILTTMSTNTSPLKAYHFKASAGKLTPVKLEAPTAKELPPFNPILPPSAISQLLLVANPNKEAVKLNFELSFTLGDTSHSDVGESPEFPQTVFP